MNASIIILKLLLDQAKIPTIAVLEFSEIAQYIVYFSKHLDILDLGYAFKWYGMPYSPSLADSYNELVDDLQMGYKDYKKYGLTLFTKKSLKKLKNLYNIPSQVNLNLKEWLKLLATYHYIEKNIKDKNKALSSVKHTEYIKHAKDALKKVNLL